MMLRHTGQFDAAAKIESAALKVSLRKSGFAAVPAPADPLTRSQTIAEGKFVTGDLRGNATTQQYTHEILKKLGA